MNGPPAFPVPNSLQGPRGPCSFSLQHARLVTPYEAMGNNSISSSLPSLLFYLIHLQFLFPHHLCGARVSSQEMLLKPCPVNNRASKTTEVQSAVYAGDILGMRSHKTIPGSWIFRQQWQEIKEEHVLLVEFQLH